MNMKRTSLETANIEYVDGTILNAKIELRDTIENVDTKLLLKAPVDSPAFTGISDIPEQRRFGSHSSYTIFFDGVTICAKNGKNGKVEFSGLEASLIIQSVLDAMVDGGIIYFSPGTFLIQANLLTDNKLKFLNHISFIGSGMGSTVLKIADGSYSQYGSMFGIGDNGDTWRISFKDITFDGNGIGQDFSESTSSHFYVCIQCKNGTAAHQETEICTLRNVEFINWTMKDSTPSFKGGIAYNGYAIHRLDANGVFFDNCDQSFYLTEPFNNSPCRHIMTNIHIRNPRRAGIMFEGFGDAVLDDFSIYNDEAEISTVPAIVIWTPAIDIKNVIISNGMVRNMGDIINVGFGGDFYLKSSVISNISAINCKGGFLFGKTDLSVIISNLSCTECCQGGISGQTKFADYEFYNDAIGNNLASYGSSQRGFYAPVDKTVNINGGAYTNGLGVSTGAGIVSLNKISGIANSPLDGLQLNMKGVKMLDSDGNMFQGKNQGDARVVGTTAGSLELWQFMRGRIKMIMVICYGYKNASTTAQYIDYPVAFDSFTAKIGDNTGMTETITNARITFPISMAGTVNGVIFIMGK